MTKQAHRLNQKTQMSSRGMFAQSRMYRARGSALSEFWCDAVRTLRGNSNLRSERRCWQSHAIRAWRGLSIRPAVHLSWQKQQHLPEEVTNALNHSGRLLMNMAPPLRSITGILASTPLNKGGLCLTRHLNPKPCSQGPRFGSTP